MVINNETAVDHKTINEISLVQQKQYSCDLVSLFQIESEKNVIWLHI